MKSASLRIGGAAESLWDSSKHKVLIYVMEGVGMPATSTSVRLLAAEKVIAKTAVVDSSDPVYWNEIFFCNLPRASTSLKIEVYAKGELCAEGNIGEANTFDKDAVVDTWISLTKINKKDASVTGAAGEVHLRMLFSSRFERGRDFAFEADDQSADLFHYDQYLSFVKDGDLLIYDAVGLLPSLTKLTSCTNFSNIGLILSLENKYTRKSEMYVAELTRNTDGRNDAFTEDKKVGLVLYPLWERVHHVNANQVWLSTIQGGIVGKELDQLRKLVWSLHRGEGDIQKHLDYIVSSALPKSISSFLNDAGLSGEKHKNEILELTCCNFILSAMTAADKIKQTSGEVKQIQLKAGTQTAEFKETTYYPPIFALGAAFLGDLVLLRERNSKFKEEEGDDENLEEVKARDEKKESLSPRGKKSAKPTPIKGDKKNQVGDEEGKGDAEEPPKSPKGSLFSKKRDTPKKEVEDSKKEDKKDDKAFEKKQEDKPDEKKDEKKAEKKGEKKDEKKEKEEKPDEKKAKDDKKEKDEKKDKKPEEKAPKDKKESGFKALFFGRKNKTKAPLQKVTVEEAKENEKVLVAEAAKAERATFADEIQTLIKRWQSAPKELTFDEFSLVMTELGFGDTVSSSLWEGVDKIDETKVAAQSVQTTFCIALSLISTGTLAQRIQRALNWVKPATPGSLSHDELLNFVVEFLYLGSETLALLSKNHQDIVDLIDVRVLVNDVISGLDPKETNQVDITTFIEYLGKIDSECLKTLQAQITAFHESSQNHAL